MRKSSPLLAITSDFALFAGSDFAGCPGPKCRIRFDPAAALCSTWGESMCGVDISCMGFIIAYVSASQFIRLSNIGKGEK